MRRKNRDRISAGKETEDNGAPAQSNKIRTPPYNERWRKKSSLCKICEAPPFFPSNRRRCVCVSAGTRSIQTVHTQLNGAFSAFPHHTLSDHSLFVARPYSVPIDLSSYVCMCVCAGCWRARRSARVHDAEYVALVLDYNWPLIATAEIGGRECTI